MTMTKDYNNLVKAWKFYDGQVDDKNEYDIYCFISDFVEHPVREVREWNSDRNNVDADGYILTLKSGNVIDTYSKLMIDGLTHNVRLLPVELCKDITFIYNNWED